MAKAKSRLITAGTKPFYSHAVIRPSVSGLDLALSQPALSVILKKKPVKKQAQSQAQLERQEEWKEADCMWKAMTIGQRWLWSDYYQVELQAGRTVKTTTNDPPSSTGAFSNKDMGQMGYFFHHALKWDLLDYLANYLQSVWLIEAKAETDTHYIVQARIVTQEQIDALFLPPEHQLVRGIW